MHRLAAAAAILTAATTGVSAQDTITIEAADGFRFLRCVDMYGDASCEFIAQGDVPLRCVALDESGEPLAASTALPSMSMAIFSEVPAENIANVVCSQ
jgi:hypothetical protein